MTTTTATARAATTATTARAATTARGRARRARTTRAARCDGDGDGEDDARTTTTTTTTRGRKARGGEARAMVVGANGADDGRRGRREVLRALAVGESANAAAGLARDDAGEARADAGEEGKRGLTRYVDSKKMFELGYPSSWAVASKPGAEVLFKNPEAKYSNIGVTVSPVTIDSLGKFGSLSEIGEKLAQAESKKESTIPGGVSVLSETERVGAKSGATFYDYEYRLITTHGNKRIFTSVSIVDSTLYILNAQVYETADPENPTEEQKAFDAKNMDLYKQVGATFDASKAIFLA